MPLSRTSVSDGAAFGAALLGGVVAGVWEDVQEAVGATVTITDTIEPDPVWVERYTELQAAFRGLYPAIRHAQPISEEVTK
jgi:xylulokinase